MQKSSSKQEDKEDYATSKVNVDVIPLDLDIMEQPDVLLTDEQVAEFIVQGYIVLRTDLPNSFHEKLYKTAEKQPMVRGTNPGNNILPALPALQQVYDCPTVRGALKSLLGEGYVMHSHRHPHCNPPGFKEQQLHKDSYWGYSKPRHHFPRWVMAMYYPQETTLKMGPTAVVPASQYLSMPKAKDRKRGSLPNAWETKVIPVTCKAGSVVIIHYDIWHKGLGNNSEKNRYMFKFQFLRMKEPTAPSWNCKSMNWPLRSVPKEAKDLTPVWTRVWTWMCGKPVEVDSKVGDFDARDCLQALHNNTPEGEHGRLRAAYTLARMGSIFNLSNALGDPDEAILRNSMYGLAASGKVAVKSLVEWLKDKSDFVRSAAAFALGELGLEGTDSTPELVKLTKDSSVWVRRNVVEALGHVGQGIKEANQLSKEVIKSLLECVADPDDQVRFQAALSIAKLGNLYSESLRPLVLATNDINRYVRANALLALEKIDKPESRTILHKLLWNSRWCDLTTAESPF